MQLAVEQVRVFFADLSWLRECMVFPVKEVPQDHAAYRRCTSTWKPQGSAQPSWRPYYVWRCEEASKAHQ